MLPDVHTEDEKIARFCSSREASGIGIPVGFPPISRKLPAGSGLEDLED